MRSITQFNPKLTTRRKFLVVGLVAGTVYGVLSVSTAKAQSDAQGERCLQFYLGAAQKEINVNEYTDSEQHLRKTFCDWARGSNENNSSTSFSAFIKAIQLNFSNDQTSRSEYEKLYCEQDTADNSFVHKYRFLSKFGDYESQKNFNACLTSDPSWHVKVVNDGTCYFHATVFYTPIGNVPDFATLQSDAQFFNATCQRPTPVKGNPINRVGTNFVRCQRYGVSETFITLATDQGKTIVIHPADVSVPQRPASPSSVPEWDEYVQKFTIHFYRSDLSSLSPGAIEMRDYDFKSDVGSWKGWNWWSTGKLRIQDDDAIVVSVQRECTGPGCGYSFSVRKDGYDADWDANGNTVTWYRRYQGDSVSDTTYIVTYKVPHRKTQEERKYDQALASYYQKVRNTCPYQRP